MNKDRVTRETYYTYKLKMSKKKYVQVSEKKIKMIREKIFLH